MKSCPNKSSIEWKLFVKNFGEDNTWKIWLKNDSSTPSIEVATFQLFMDAEPTTAADLLVKHLSEQVKMKLKLGMDPNTLISLASKSLFNEYKFKDWARKERFYLEATLSEEEIAAPVVEEDPLVTMASVPQVNVFEQNENMIRLLQGARAEEISKKLGDLVSKKRGVTNSLISEGEATIQLAKSDTPYNGKPVFIFTDNIYFIKNKIDLNTTLTEMSPALLFSMYKRDPKILDSTYQRIQDSPEGKELIDQIKANQPKLIEDSIEFKIEVLQSALEKGDSLKRGLKENKDLTYSKLSEPFRLGLNAIIHNTRSELRDLVGKDANKVESTTTLNTLAETLAGKNFKVVMPTVTVDNVNTFSSELRGKIEETKRAIENNDTSKIVQVMLNNFYNITGITRQQVKGAPYKDVRKHLIDESTGKGLILKMANELHAVQTVSTRDNKEKNITVANQVLALVNSVASAEEFVKQMTHFLQDVKINNRDDKDSLTKVFYYSKNMRDWKSFVGETRDLMNAAGLDNNSALYNQLSHIETSIADAQKIIKQITEDSVTNVMHDMIREHSAKINQQFEDVIKDLNKNPRPSDPAWQKAMSEAQADKIKYTVTKENVAALIRGDAGDANWWAGMFTNYSSNPNPLVAVFSIMIENAYTKAFNKMIKRTTTFDNTTEKGRAQAGMTGTDVRKENQVFIQEDSNFQYVDGKLQEYKVRSFLQPVKNWRWGVKQLEVAVDDAIKTGDQEEIRKAHKELVDHKLKYFHQEYKPEYYIAESKLLETAAGVEAYAQRQEILDKIRLETGSNPSEYDIYQSYDETSELWKQYSKLSSLTDDFGNLKSDESIDGKPSDLAVAKALQEHRKRVSPYYEYKEVSGSFEAALIAWEQQMITAHPEESKDPLWLDKERKKWIAINTTQGFTPEYYSFVATQYEALQKLVAQLPKDIQDKNNVAEIYAEISDLLSSEKDMFGQPSRENMKDSKFNKIKELQEKINKLREDYDLKSGLSLNELAELEALNNKIDEADINEDEKLNEQDKLRWKVLSNKRTSGMETAAIGRQMAQIFKILSALKGKVPTKEYLNTYNNYTPILGLQPLDELSASKILDREVAEELMTKDAVFAKWFLENHIKAVFIDFKTNKKDYRYERVAAWSIAVPKNPVHKLTTTLKRIDEATGQPVVISGAPNMKYRFRSVKAKYRTIPLGTTDAQKNEEFVGKIIDNQGHFLPRTHDDNGNLLNSPYVNGDYFRLEKEKPELFKLLGAMTKFHLESQQGTIYGGKLYLDLPRYRVDDLEKWQSGQVWSQLKQKGASVGAYTKAIISGAGKQGANEAGLMAGDFDAGLTNATLENEKEELETLSSMTFSSGREKIPITGTSKMSIEDASMDILTIIKMYGLSAEKQKVLMELDPIATGIINTISGNHTNDLTAVQNHGKVTNSMTPLSKGTNEIALKTITSLYNREFQGKIFNEGHLDGLNKVTGAILGAASFNYFALNLPSAIKNYWGMLWQMNIEAAAGEYMNFTSLAKGKLWAKTAIKEWSTSIYGTSNNSLYIQMIKHFDPMRGKYEDSHADRSSRTFLKDVVSLTWLYSPRKFMELEGSLQLFGGMMAHTLIDRTVNGKTTKIAYLDAFELNSEGIMSLKSGIDPAYDIDGAKYLEIRNTIHAKANDLNGSFSKFDKPQAQQYFAYRLFNFMRSYFTDMFLHRFGTKRANYKLGKVRRGYYVESMLTISKIIKTLGKHLNTMNFEEKRATYKMLSDVSQMLITSFIVSVLFGFDEDDPDRFEKMRARSGALGTEEFEPLGFLANHTLTLLMKTQNENESFIPLSGFGLEDYVNMASSGSVAFNPTIKTYSKILADITGHAMPGEDASLYYQRDVGPYPWQQEESAKIWNHFFTSIGVTGSDIDPIKAAKSFEAVTRR